MPSPSTMILRSGGAAAGSCLAGGGAREKSSRTTRFGSCCWNGANSSPPNQPPNPERCCGCGREGPPKLKNWAEAGPATPSSSVAATVTAISGPASQNTRKNDFGWAMRFGSKQGNPVPDILAESGRKRADQVADSSAINRPSAAAVKGGAELSGSRLPRGRNRVTARAEPGYRKCGIGCQEDRNRVPNPGTPPESVPAEPLQHVGRGKSVRRRPDRGLEAAQRVAGLAAELAVRRALIEAALDQKLLQFQPFGFRQL